MRAHRCKRLRILACVAICRKIIDGCRSACALRRIRPKPSGRCVVFRCRGDQLFGAGCGVYLLLPSPMKRRRRASLAALQRASPIFAWSSLHRRCTSLSRSGLATSDSPVSVGAGFRRRSEPRPIGGRLTKGKLKYVKPLEVGRPGIAQTDKCIDRFRSPNNSFDSCRPFIPLVQKV